MRLSFPPLKSYTAFLAVLCFLAPSAWAATATKLAISGAPAFVHLGGTPGAVTVTIESSTGAVVTTSTASVTLTITGPNSFSATVTANAVAGVATLAVTSADLGAAGAYTLTATSGTLTKATAALTVLTGSSVMATTAVGTAAPAQTIDFGFTAATTVGGVQVLFEGAPNLDFTLGGGGTCVGTHAANATCAVPVIFTPQAMGRREGVIELTSAATGGTVLQTLFISGTGTGAAINFSPSQQVSIGTNLGYPDALAFDPQGNLYIAAYPADGGAGNVVKLPLVGGVLSTAGQTVFGSGLNYVDGMVFDGAGDFFVSDYDENEIIEVPANGGANIVLLSNPSGGTSNLYNPAGLAVDGAGDLFICDYSNNRVLELLNQNGTLNAAAPIVLGTGLSAPSGVKVDASGNLIVADWGNARIVEIPLQNGAYNSAAQTTLVTDPGLPSDVALDAAGDLYIALEASNEIEVVPNQSGSFNQAAAYFLTQNLNGPDSVLLDNDNNVYFCDTYNGFAYSLNTVTPPALAFPSTAVGVPTATQTVPVISSGNVNLSINGITFDPAFPSQGSTCTGNLAVGTSCNLSVDFSPNAIGAVAAAAVISDTAINQSGNTQTVPMSGTGTQGSQVIQFATAGPFTYGQVPVTLSATGGASGNPVTFTLVSGPATLANGVLTITGAGAIVVNANQAGNTLYTAAPSVSQTITVSPAILTVTANTAGMDFGASLPSFTYTITGFVNNDSASVVTGAPSFTTTATSASPAGSYPITVGFGTLAAANYNFVFVGNTLTVSAATSTATWKPAATSVVYGQPLGAAELNATSSTPGTWVYTNGRTVLNANSTLPAGSYNITATLTPTNTSEYTTVTVSANITVTPAVLTVTASSISLPLGLAIPSLTGYTITGFVNGDTQSVITGSPVLSTTATLLSLVGSYPITISTAGMSAANYTFITVPGTLTIGQGTTPTTWVPTVGTTFAYGPTFSVFMDASSTIKGTWTYKFNGASGITAATLLPVGNWQVEATFTPADTTDYSTVTLDFNFTVTPAVLTYTALPANGTMTVGGTVPALSYTVSGFQDGDTAAVVAGTPTLATAASPTANAGTYPVTISFAGMSAGNYTFVGVPGSITITPVAPTVSLSGVPSGLVYGQALGNAMAANASVAGTWALAANGVAVTTASVLPAGTYTITGTFTPSSANYSTIAAAPLVGLVVAPAPLTVTANNATMASGGAVPSLAYTITGFVGADTAASATTGAAAVSTTATSSSPAGSYPITVSQGTLAAANYTFTTFVPGTLTVTAAATLPYTTSTSVSHSFNQYPINRGSTIWFDGRFDASGIAAGTVISFQNATITFTANRQTVTIPVPNATITYSAAATQATTTYNAATQTWQTVAPVPHATDQQQLHHGWDHGAAWGNYGGGQYFNWGYDGQADYGSLFLDGVAYTVPTAGLPGNIQNVTWSGTIASNNAATVVHWDWSAADYSNWNANDNALGVIAAASAPYGRNNTVDVAGTPENYQNSFTVSLTGGYGSQGLDNGWGESCGDRTQFNLPGRGNGNNGGFGGFGF